MSGVMSRERQCFQNRFDYVGGRECAVPGFAVCGTAYEEAVRLTEMLLCVACSACCNADSDFIHTAAECSELG